MSILSEARTKVEYLEDYYRRREAGYHPECEPLAVSEAAAILPILLAYAETREAQSIELKAKIDYPNYDELPEEDRVEKRYIGDKGDFHELHYRGKKTLRQEAAKELSADLPPRITEEEKAAIIEAIGLMGDSSHIPGEIDYSTADYRVEIEILRGMIR